MLISIPKCIELNSKFKPEIILVLDLCLDVTQDPDPIYSFFLVWMSDCNWYCNCFNLFFIKNYQITYLCYLVLDWSWVSCSGCGWHFACHCQPDHNRTWKKHHSPGLRAYSVTYSAHYSFRQPSAWINISCYRYQWICSCY